MRILRIDMKGSTLFDGTVSLCLNTVKGVRASNVNGENDLSAYKIKSGIYTQVAVGFIGLNATGKTAILDFLSAVMLITVSDERLNNSGIANVLKKLLAYTSGKLEWNVYFLNGKTIYRLQSIVTDEDGKFIYDDETIWYRSLRGANGSNLYDDGMYEFLTDRKQQSGNVYLKPDISIVTGLNQNDIEIKFLQRFVNVNVNVPLWEGRPYEEIIHCFDPSIERLRIGEGGRATIKFDRQDGDMNGRVENLMDLLSSGTIKGLSIFPALIDVLGKGGYMVVDELENHFNKKIVEWIIGLFCDKKTNPYGACLIFSTHYPEIIDCFTRNDNIYITRRNENNMLQCVRFCDFDEVSRNDLTKSKIILSNIIKGTAPKYKLFKEANDYISMLVGAEKRHEAGY